MRQVYQRCQDWIAKDAVTKPPLVRLIETDIAEGMADKVRALVKAGEDLNAHSLLKETPLEFARYFGHRDVFDVLIELGADGEKAGVSRLHHVVRYGDAAAAVPVIDSFISYGGVVMPIWSCIRRFWPKRPTSFCTAGSHRGAGTDRR